MYNRLFIFTVLFVIEWLHFVIFAISKLELDVICTIFELCYLHLIQDLFECSQCCYAEFVMPGGNAVARLIDRYLSPATETKWS
jgi:hypothetical protein